MFRIALFRTIFDKKKFESFSGSFLGTFFG
jgi:hypothetical protein